MLRYAQHDMSLGRLSISTSLSARESRIRTAIDLKIKILEGDENQAGSLLEDATTFDSAIHMSDPHPTLRQFLSW